MSRDPAASVIVRTVDRGQRLGEALESLARQTERRFEAVVVDMGAIAGPVVERFRSRLPRLRHLRPGRALSRPAALNEGIREAAAGIVAILDDDNLFDPPHLERLIGGLEGTGADLVFTGVRRATYSPEGELIESLDQERPFDLTRLREGNYIYTAGTAFHKRIWKEVGGYDIRFPVGEDYDFLLRVAAAGRIASLPGVTAESRSFTGTPGVQNHALEVRSVRRSTAGLYWRHPALRGPAWRRDTSALRSVTGAHRWRRRAQVLADLAGWWWHCASPAARARNIASRRRSS